MLLLDLFSGVGGFTLAAHSVGIPTLAFCEIDPYCQKVLARHYPGVPIFPDVKELTSESLADTAGVRQRGDGALEGEARNDGRRLLKSERNGSRRDVADTDRGRREQRDSHERGLPEPHALGAGLILTAGFPCQDISYAGKGAGLAGERSGLFYEVARLVDELRPGVVLLENVAGLLTRGLAEVLGTLASLRYRVLWSCIPAAAVGAPHRRDRIWLVAIPDEDGSQEKLQRIYDRVLSRLTPFGSETWYTPNTMDGMAARSEAAMDNVLRRGDPSGTLRNGTGNLREQVGGSLNPDWVETLMGYPVGYTRPEGEPQAWLPNVWPAGLGAPQHDWEPPRLTTERENRAARLKALGNSIVPQVARLWFEAIWEEC